MLKQILSILFATQLAVATCASGQTIQPSLSDLVEAPVSVDATSNQIQPHPFVSGHSIVPHTARTRFETDGDCGQCGCQHQVCVCGDKKAQRKAELQYKYWGYPELFCERPHGAYLRSHLDAQIAKGIAGQMILYRYDFYDVGLPQASALKPVGHRTISKIVELATISPTPIMIETSGDAGLDAARRATVIQAFNQMSFPIADDQVVTIARDPFGMSGDEAAMSHQTMLQHTESSSTSGGNSQEAGIVPIFPLFGQ